MAIRYTRPFLSKLEDIFAESEYILRYEKGNFKAGYCILKEMKVVVVNKYFPLEGKINCLYEILRNLPLNTDQLSEKNREIYLDLTTREHTL